MNIKGQVTLPVLWRERINTDTVIIEERGTQITISPAEIITGEEVLFDAIRDNNGKGIPISDLVKALQDDLK